MTAEQRGLERTTLTRNLDRLEGSALIESRLPRWTMDVSARYAEGQAVMAELLPIWRKAQTEMRTLLSGDGFEASLRTLKRLAEV
jgi:hypothetical protein